MAPTAATMTAEALAPYLARILGGPVAVLAVRPLKGADAAGDPKGLGYGVPLEVECTVGGAPRHLVIARTRPTQGFSHDYPADRAWQALFGHPAYNSFPRHVRSLDVGVLRASGAIDSLADAAEVFQVVEHAEGTLYWLDLQHLLDAPLRDLDVERATALARFLADVHGERRDEPTLYHRRVRELIGHGECLMGILDSYPHPYALLPVAACRDVERAAVDWRWRLRDRTHRLARTHGDFHPWNLLFRARTDFTVLDRSRGEWGEPADDVAALAINYLFFGLQAQAAGVTCGHGSHLALFRAFLDAYLTATGDAELLEVLPPFLAFRALVIGHPGWYPSLPDWERGRLLGWAQELLEGAVFDPVGMHGLFDGLP